VGFSHDRQHTSAGLLHAQQMINASIQRFELAEDVSVDDAIESMQLRANMLNFKMVADLPLSEQVQAMGQDANYMRILAFCDALIAKKMVEYNIIFAGFLPCRVAVLEDGVGVTLDVLDCGERYCINSCGLGFEAQVTKNSRSIQRLKGLPLYLLALGKALAEHSCPKLTITLESGEVIAGERLLVSVGNGVSAGGGFYLTPDAVPDDGLIDLCVVEKMGRIKMLGLLPLSLKGTHTTRREVDMRRTRSVTVESEGPLHMHIDGEYLGDERRSISFTVLDRRLPVLCKKDTPGLFSQTPQKLLK